MQKRWFGVAAASGFLAVALGAFGSHSLKAVVTASELAVWQTAVQYQMFHTLALLAVSLLPATLGRRTIHWLGGLFAVGILLFSGSLYTMVLTGIRGLGAITPIGGVTLLAAWLLLLIAALRSRRWL